MGIAAGAPYMKESVRKYVQYLENQLEKYASSIHVHYNKTATIEDIQAFGADTVIVATGGEPIIPPIYGMKDNPKVIVATEYLKGRNEVNGDVIVIGAGLVGCETALDVAHKGHKVTMIEMLDRIVAKRHQRQQQNETQQVAG